MIWPVKIGFLTEVEMIEIIAGGKKHLAWAAEACAEYEKRLRKPYQIEWRFMDEAKLEKYLADWPFDRAREFVICCDERGKIISSPELAEILEAPLISSRDVVILIGGAYGFTDEVRNRADFVWSFSRLVFPHMLARVMVMEQIYRASAITAGQPYHHA